MSLVEVKNYVSGLVGDKMRLAGMTLDNSKPRNLEQIFISLGCLRYRSSTAPFSLNF